ncbi:MAG: NAD(P)/FAD-dependent oxidoreductase [Spirochaetia bacterium]
MKEKKYDALIVGGGSAGMAAASEIAKAGYTVAIVEKESALGGILNQCIHNGFGLQYFKEELTGPEFAERFVNIVQDMPIDIFTETTIMQVEDEEGFEKTVYGYSAKHGFLQFTTKSVVLAMGCRERNRGNIGTPGSRPSGVYTAGLAQRLVNMDGYIPGKEVVIVGSGDIGLIMARRMTWVGSNVKAVIEIQPNPAGLTRNIVQCLNDFNIPLYLSHVVSEIHGNQRVESVVVTPLENGIADHENSFTIDCDTVLLSVGLVPDNEVTKKFGAEISPVTNGAIVDSRLMTTVPGVFSCGNVLHVHDLVDYVTEESIRCGSCVVKYLQKDQPKQQFRTTPGPNVRYVVPNQYNPEEENKFFFRPLIVKNKATVQVKLDGKVIKEKRVSHIQPSEMVELTLKPDLFEEMTSLQDNKLEIGII